MAGHNCDNCGKKLKSVEYFVHKGWSYECFGCGFTFNHSSILTAQEQVNNFNDEQDEIEDMYNEDIERDEEE